MLRVNADISAYHNNYFNTFKKYSYLCFAFSKLKLMDKKLMQLFVFKNLAIKKCKSIPLYLCLSNFFV